MSNIIHMIK